MRFPNFPRRKRIKIQEAKFRLPGCRGAYRGEVWRAVLLVLDLIKNLPGDYFCGIINLAKSIENLSQRVSWSLSALEEGFGVLRPYISRAKRQVCGEPDVFVHENGGNYPKEQRKSAKYIGSRPMW